ncbi:MAG: OmpA family protein [Paludibacteraceae bacterium]|nr:OmpA family protein [Paludibacteraceae bacterium]
MKRIRSIIPLFLFSLLAFSQSEKEKEADKYYREYSFDKAIDKYNEVKELSVEGLRKLAESYHSINKFAEAKAIYAKIVNDPLATTNDYYNYILLLKADGKYAETKKWYEKIKEKAPNDLRAKNFFDTEPKFQSMLKASNKYSISDLRINTQDQDFGPAFYKDKIAFTSSRKEFKLFQKNYNWNKKPFLDIYVADQSANHELENINYWNKKISEKWHQGPICFAENGTFAAFTRNDVADGVPADGIVRLQLFFSRFENGEWTDPEPFYLNNPASYSVGHPSLSKDGNTLYFVSDMPGGYGGSDIYVVTKESGNSSWGKPVNLGNKINTEANELFPFYEDKSGLLFFSSNGLNGLGGLDVYVATKTPRGFENIQNVGAPINTPYDDFAYIIAENFKYGYFSSNRPEGKGDDDIYAFTYTGEFKKSVPPPPPPPIIIEQKILPKTEYAQSFTYKLYVLNKDSHQPISNADIKLGDLSLVSDNTGMISHTFNQAIDYKVAINTVGYKQKHLRVNVSTFRNGYVLTDTILMEANVLKKIELKNIYYDYDKANILPESSVELDKVVTFLHDNPKLQVELGSHTDSRGSDEYNLKLSEERAKSAVDYIIGKGIDAQRITGKGYGETQLINGCSNGVPCSEKEHRRNRRTEIFISGYGKASDVKQIKGKE